MSALATSTLLVVTLVTAMLLAWWRTILKFLVVSLLVLSAVGVAEVVGAVIGGFSPN